MSRRGRWPELERYKVGRVLVLSPADWWARVSRFQQLEGLGKLRRSQFLPLDVAEQHGSRMGLQSDEARLRSVDGSPRSGDCGSPVKWKRFTTCPFKATVKSVPSTVISSSVPLPKRMDDQRTVGRALEGVDGARTVDEGVVRPAELINLDHRNPKFTAT